MRLPRPAPTAFLLAAALAAGCRSIPSDPMSADADLRRAAADRAVDKRPIRLGTPYYIKLGMGPDAWRARNRAALPMLRMLLSDAHLEGVPSHPHVRGAAARALGIAGLPEAASDLAAALGADSSPQVREDAATALGDLGAPAGAPALRAALARADETPEVKRAAARALGRLGDGAAIPGLRAAMRNADRTVVFAAREALARIVGRDYGLNPLAWERPDVDAGTQARTPR